MPPGTEEGRLETELKFELAPDAVRALRGGQGFQVGRARRLRSVYFDTPGHARHHHCIWDDRSRAFFTGDTFGLSYREFDTVGR